MNAAATPPLASVVVAVEHQPARVLLVDSLTVVGYETIAVDRAEQALWQLESASVDALLVDVGAQHPELLDRVRWQTQRTSATARNSRSERMFTIRSRSASIVALLGPTVATGHCRFRPLILFSLRLPNRQ